MPSTALEPAVLDAVRRRSLWTLVGGVGLSSTGYIAAVTVSTIVAQQLAGTSAWAGVPGATLVMGSATGSALLSWLMARRGRRSGLTVGYLVGALGALVAAIALGTRSFPLFLLGTALMGFANSANLLARYAAADLVPAARRASAIGTVVWGSTVGAILGPNLVTPAGELARTAGLPTLGGAYLALVLFVGLAGVLSFVLLRPDPMELADRGSEGLPVHQGSRASVGQLLRRPPVIVAMVALIAGQIVMVLIMTMTPLHMTDHGHDIGAVGIVLSGHVFGMYALSPVTGWLTERFGSPQVIVAGLATLAVAAALSSAAPPNGGAFLFLALFLLGYGWNLGFVAGSTLLSSGLAAGERTRMEGTTDALIWSSSAAASLGSGLVVAVAGFAALGLLGMGLVVAAAVVLATRRRSLTVVG